MKILYVSKLSPDLGLPHIQEVASRMVERGNEVHVLSAKTRAGQPRDLQLNGISIRACATAPGWLRSRGALGFFASRLPFYLLSAYAVSRRYRDVDVIIEDVAPLRSPWLPDVAKRLGIPLIYHTHNAYPQLSSWTATYGTKGVFGWIWDRLFRRKPRCAALITAAKYTADSYQTIGCEVRWIPNGIDSRQFSPRFKERSAGAPLRLLSVGRVVSLKNHRLLIRALAATSAALELRIIGDGPARLELASLAHELGVSDRVTLTGFMDKSKIHEEYQAADLFVLPSLWEGLPHVLLEAMASGLPIAMSDIEAHQGVVEPAYGWVLPKHDVTAWSELFASLAARPDCLLDMGKAARKAAVAWADWDQVTDDVLGLISRVREPVT